ncbi:MAG TPA: copper-binding protein [Candidatus Kapabacteria bacterium]|nr:copper-binding protein [Candidatus Kapabacteria bacterium]
MLTALAGLSALLSCSKQEQSGNTNDTALATTAAVKQGQGRGLVQAIDSSGKSVTLDHNDIPGIMDAMAMSYPVESPQLLQGVKPGDSVIFTLKEPEPGEYVVSAISSIKH